MELGIFLGAFNSACYLFLQVNPSKSDLDKFTQHIAKMTVDNLLDKDKIDKTADVDIKDFIAAISKHYSNRLSAYIGLLNKEAQKAQGTSSYVDITSCILNNLYETKISIEERYDPLFAALLANHISAFDSLLKKDLR